MYLNYLIFITFLCIIPGVNVGKISVEDSFQNKWHCHIDNNQWNCIEDNKENILFSKEKKLNNIANILNWIPTDDSNNICGGYYYQNLTNLIGNNSEEVEITAQSYQYKKNGETIAEGSVELIKDNQYLSADKVVISKNTENKFNQINLIGNVNFKQPGLLIISTEGKADIGNDTAILDDTYYLVRTRKQNNCDNFTSFDNNSFCNKDNNNNGTGFIHGYAQKIIQNSKNRYTLKKVTCSTGNPYSDSWMLYARHIDLDRELGIGKAKNIIYYVKGIPILYWPYLKFPIDGHRHTGFLHPTIGYKSNFGHYINIPFYWKISPNYNFLLNSIIYKKPEILFDGKLRYLTKVHNGSIRVKYSPYNANGKSYRELHYIEHAQYNQKLSSNINYHYKSKKGRDASYQHDFNSPEKLFLERKASLSYKSSHLYFNLLFQSYHILNDEMYLVNRPYSKLPQIHTTISYPWILPYVNLSWENQFTYFYKGNLNKISQVQAQRLYSAPTISIPIRKTWGYFIPSLTLSETTYMLQKTAAVDTINFAQNNYPNKVILRSLAIFNINAALHFDKKFKLNNQYYIQTLEPRLIYTYIPYKNQNNIPLFDTSLNNFSYESLSQTNIFTGIDRINNANKFSYLLETSISNRLTHNKILNAGIGQNIQLERQKVLLHSNIINSGHTKKIYDSLNFSDIAIFLNAKFLNYWAIKISHTYSPKDNIINLQLYQIEYEIDETRTFYLRYKNIRNDYTTITPFQIQLDNAPQRLSEIQLSTAWKISSNWSVNGHWNYSFNQKRTTDIFADIKYDTCSWSVKFLARRYISHISDPNHPIKITGPLENTFTIKFELKGLGGGM